MGYDQILVIRDVSEKYSVNGKELYIWAYIELQKPFVVEDRDVIVEDAKAIQSFCRTVKPGNNRN